MTPDQYWMMKMTQYIDRFTLFRTMMTQATGITDDEAIQAHWELFADNLCDCEECTLSDEDDTVTVRVPSDYINKVTDDEGWDDETPSWA